MRVRPKGKRKEGRKEGKKYYTWGWLISSRVVSKHKRLSYVPYWRFARKNNGSYVFSPSLSLPMPFSAYPLSPSLSLIRSPFRTSLASTQFPNMTSSLHRNWKSTMQTVYNSKYPDTTTRTTGNFKTPMHPSLVGTLRRACRRIRSACIMAGGDQNKNSYVLVRALGVGRFIKGRLGWMG